MRHADLLASLNAPDGRLASVPSFVSEVPTVDLFVHTEAVRIVTPHEVREPGQETRIVSLRVIVRMGHQRGAGPARRATNRALGLVMEAIGAGR